jgi:hypothetical protein
MTKSKNNYYWGEASGVDEEGKRHALSITDTDRPSNWSMITSVNMWHRFTPE